jgi:hypothetical protein
MQDFKQPILACRVWVFTKLACWTQEAEAPDAAAIVERCINQSLANVVMLKDGMSSDEEIRRVASNIQMVCRERGVNFILESRLGAAACVLADGYQLPENTSAHLSLLHVSLEISHLRHYSTVKNEKIKINKRMLTLPRVLVPGVVRSSKATHSPPPD